MVLETRLTQETVGGLGWIWEEAVQAETGQDNWHTEGDECKVCIIGLGK